MCLNILSKEAKELTSPTDITCYKVMVKDNTDKVFSLIYPDRYKAGYEFNTKYTARDYNENEVSKLETFPDDDFIGIAIGFHSFRDAFTALSLKNKFPETVVVRCEIPKDTPYYQSQSHYASLHIIFKEIL